MLLLAIFPACIAILLELCNPLSDAVFTRQAKEAIEVNNLGGNNPEVMAEFAKGATSVSGVAPTLTSVFTAALAVLHDLPPIKLFWWLYAVFLILVVLALMMVREIMARGFYNMAITHVTVFEHPTPVKYTTLHSIYIYVLNGLLIVLCYFLW